MFRYILFCGDSGPVMARPKDKSDECTRTRTNNSSSKDELVCLHTQLIRNDIFTQSSVNNLNYTTQFKKIS